MIPAMTTTLYGIPNCDTVKKARAWLDEHGVAYQFHDFKKQGVPAANMGRWVAALGWEPLVNRKGTMWRKLPDEVKAKVVDAASAQALMADTPSVIKRPVVEWATARGKKAPPVTVGFSADQWAGFV